MDGIVRTKSFTVDRRSYLRTMWARGLPKRLAISGGLFAATVVGYGFAFGAATALGLAAVLAVFLVLMVPLRYLLARRNVYGKEMSLVFDDPRTIAFSVEGVRVRTQGGIESQVPWANFNRVERRGGFLLLFMTKIQHFIVPEDAFASAGDRAALDALFKAKSLPVRSA